MNAIAWQCSSLLLAYPDAALAERLQLVRTAADVLPARLGDPIRECAARLAEGDVWDLAAEYVATFDARRRHNLFLTYFAYGDTRKRGMALLRFKQAYQAAGVELADDELPDHLCVVLEFAGTVDADQGLRLLLDHRAGLELLRLGLVEGGSRWAGAVQAVTATLPPLKGDEVEAIRRLAIEGPPEEEVGLMPYSTVDLPMPSFPGGR